MAPPPNRENDSGLRTHSETRHSKYGNPMVELEEPAYQIATLALILLLTDLAVGLLLERTGLLPGAEQLSLQLAEVLFVVVGIAGLALLVISWWTSRVETETNE